ncbi:XAC2610-related protein [Flavobacterium procerum]|uniref:XAC2610-related protein n=1 Tax=Flavobacterium procerum TaxID=1455569 RepID=A0ABV6BNJ4_9FLAO
MKKLLVLFMFGQFVFAQKTTVTTSLHFSGKIDKYPIEMTIDFQQGKDSVSGSYYYVKSGKDNTILLRGIFKNNELKLAETTYIPKKSGNVPTITGSFSLQLNANYELSGNWQNAKKDKQFSATLSCLEDLQSFNPKNYSYKLNPHKGKATNFSNQLADYYLISQLDIYDSKKQKIQTISNFNNVLSDNIGKIEFEDLNFDGLLDIKIPIYFPDRIKYDGSFLYLIYDKTKKQFVRNTKLEELEYLFFDQKNKEFVRYEGDGSGNDSSHYYKWFNKSFYLAREIISYENSDKTTYIEYQIKNNKSVKVREYQK